MYVSKNSYFMIVSANEYDTYISIFCPICGKRMIFEDDDKIATCEVCSNTYDIVE